MENLTLSQASHARTLGTVLAAAAMLVAALVLAPPAAAGIFGSTPVNISVGYDKSAPNGSSGNPSVSGDNRTARYVAFDSAASNLVRGDRNERRDIFVWTRPRKGFPTSLRKGSLRRVSVGPGGREADGHSREPSVSGSLNNRARCVAFASTATNLSTADRTPDSDIFVRDLKRGRTYLVSRGVSGEAEHPSISGNCRKVAFEADGRVWIAEVRGARRAKSIGPGASPKYSRDSRSLVFNRGSNVFFRHGGSLRRVGRGSGPVVSDRSPVGGWGVAFNRGSSVGLSIVRSGHVRRTTAVRRAKVGCVTSMVAHRGIVVWWRGSHLYYQNRNSGNSDDLAHARHAIEEADCSARANLVAFSTAGGRGFIDNSRNRQKSVYVKWLPK